MKKSISNISIGKFESVVTALKKMDEVGHKLLIVMSDGNYEGLLSIGDIQRSIINNVSLNESIATIMRNDYVVAHPNENLETIKKIMFEIRSEFMPVVNSDNKIVDVHFWGDLFGEKSSEPVNKFDLPIVIMAGGFGTRLRPLTYVIPKPLIPIGEKTMLEEIFDRFGKFGCKEFHISVNYKSELIRYYIDNQNLTYDISYFEEDKPMGTAGSLSLLRDKIDKPFFVTNCDIIIEQDYSEILDYHKKNENEITVVAALKHLSIPYGTIETGEDGLLLSMKEKPDLDFMINAGMYILEPHLLDEIPTDKFFHITHLIEKLRQRGGKVGVFPVSEKSWKDIGEWSEYIKNKDND